MANSLKFIKKVNHEDAANNLQVLFQFILGSDTPNKHDRNNAYSDGEFVYSYVEAEGEFHVFMAMKDAPIGTSISNAEYWQRMSIKDLISQGIISLGKNEDIITISNTVPTQENNDIWLKPVKYKTFNPGIGGEPGIGEEVEDDSSLVFDCEHIVGQDDEPDDPNVKLWFDYEFDHEGKPIPIKVEEEEPEEENDDTGYELPASLLKFDDFSDF